MPWNNTPTTEQRQKFVTLANSGRFGVSELCLEFGVTPSAGTSGNYLTEFAVCRSTVSSPPGPII
jgi:hypothetical protein